MTLPKNMCVICKYSSDAPQVVTTHDGAASYEEDTWHCRRYPPTLVHITNEKRELFVFGQYPPVEAHGWCGEYEAVG